MTIKEYIKNKKINHFRIQGIEIFEKDVITNNIDAKFTVTAALKNIPDHLLSNVDSIYIGSFDLVWNTTLMAGNGSIFFV